jgi:hypothetical protein
MSIRALVAALAATLALPVAVHAAVAVSPTSGELTTSHPVLTWFLGPGETTRSVAISSSPATTPDGSFYDENVVDQDYFGDSTTRWAPTSPLWAGRYWWSVRTYDADYNDRATPPETFRVAPRIRLTGMGITRYAFLREVDFDPRGQSNVRSLHYTFKVRSIRRRLLRRFGGAFSQFTTIEWHARRNIRQGSRVRVELAIFGAGKRVVWRRIMRAP